MRDQLEARCVRHAAPQGTSLTVGARGAIAVRPRRGGRRPGPRGRSGRCPTRAAVERLLDRDVDAAARRRSRIPSAGEVPARSTGIAPGCQRRVALLGAVGPVALAPAQVGLAEDLALELQDRVDQRLRPRRAAGDVDVDRQELVGALDHRVVGEHAAGGGAGAHREDPLRLQHLVVDAADDRDHLDRDAAREDQHVGLPRRGAEDLGPEARGVVAGRDHRHHLDRAAGEAEGGREERVAARPRSAPSPAWSSSPASSTYSSRSTPVEVAAQHVARLHLAHPQLLRARGLIERAEPAQLGPLYFQLRAPRRQT